MLAVQRQPVLEQHGSATPSEVCYATNNQLRCRVVNAIRDGRTLIGNHPPGAGCVWRNWDEIVFFNEYVRVRQHEEEIGEATKQESANQVAAARRAESPVVAIDQPSVADFVEPPTPAASQETPGTFRKHDCGRLSSVLLRDADRPKRTPKVEQLKTRAQQLLGKVDE
ncbi:hypothetical protein CONLIGDRAFT_685845 [Coniochaeta ligniaria NRRL 30616]|uniref:Uncharacterized protein n=1 Tax=Coniochaeta ligniaria NRRL 30616 TaxID=1408157 RepID=A0A1J7J9L8_9PEZI|nr:hypothetical protein CONLIGDRAFT_685845 [Coniochaeta ligniaria NRRL 30616]